MGETLLIPRMRIEADRFSTPPKSSWALTRGADFIGLALEALKALYDDTAEYITINHLGDVHHNQSMRLARDVLDFAERHIGPPSRCNHYPGQTECDWCRPMKRGRPDG